MANAASYGNSFEAPTIEIGAQRFDGLWRFTVVDDGPGVPIGVRNNIFTMFVRGAPADDGHRGDEDEPGAVGSRVAAISVPHRRRLLLE